MRPATPPPPPPDPEERLDQLVATCLALYEDRGAVAVDEFLSDHPESSGEVKGRLQRLAQLGLLGESFGEALPPRIGPYKIVRQLGRGGMGVVFEAESEHPRRSVALKVLRSSTTSRHRFRHEVELLGRLQHPGIAALYDAGTAELGGVEVPYFAMELIRGSTLDRHCAERSLDARARLELLARVADAVHYAHERGVIHRDLKPANVLVDEHGATRVMDFGVARVVSPELELSSLATLPGQVIGTLAYMSPEQASGRTNEIGTPSDVYSLGVTAYELLTGHPPNAVENRSALEALRAIAEDVPERLGALDPRLSGDVETIVAKALEKEPGRRYASARELAEDLRRHLNDEPINARPATAAYQLSRFARRHKLLVGMSALLLATLVLGLLGTARGLRAAKRGAESADRARERALARLAEAEAVLEFQESILRSPDPAVDGRGVLVVDVLARAVLGLQSAGQEPRIQASLMRAAGEAYLGLGQEDRGTELLEQALTLFESPAVDDLEQALLVKIELAGIRSTELADKRAAPDRLRALEVEAELALGADHQAVIDARKARVDAYFEVDRFEESAELAAELADSERVPLQIRQRMRIQHAQALWRLGREAEALELARGAHEELGELLGRSHPETLWALEAYGALAHDAGQSKEGLRVTLQALELRREHLGDEHPDTVQNMANAATLHWQLADIEEGLALAREAGQLASSRFPEKHTVAMFAKNVLATILASTNSPAEALQLFEELAVTATEANGPEHFETLLARANLAGALVRVQEYERADQILEEVLEIRRRKLGELHAQTLHILYQMGDSFMRQGRLELAEARLRAAVEGARESGMTASHWFPGYLVALAKVLARTDRLTQSRDALEEARALYVERSGEGSHYVGVVDKHLVEVRGLLKR